MSICPLTKGECTVNCAWFYNGECYMANITELIETLESISGGIDEVACKLEKLDNTIADKDFTV